jgi:hypothetical protein
MGLAAGDEDPLGQHPIEYGVELDGPFAGPELGPGKDAGAEVDGSGIDDFDLRRFLRLGGQFAGEPLVQLIIGFFEDDGGALLGEFSGVRPLPDMAVRQVLGNMSQYEL